VEVEQHQSGTQQPEIGETELEGLKMLEMSIVEICSNRT